MPSTTWSRCAASTRPDARRPRVARRRAAAASSRRSAGGSPSSTPLRPRRTRDGATAALHAALAENADTLLALAPDRDFARRAAALARFTEAFFAARRDELEARAGAGRVRDGHGDLRAEHILLERGVEIVDCLEFDPALRVADAGCDLAFLTMDLEALGAFEAARSVLAGYRAAGGDPGDDDLVAFFAGYRALVRAKVALIRADQSDDPSRACIADARIAARRWPSGSRGARGGRGSSSSPGSRRAARPSSPPCSPPAPACATSTPTRFASGFSASRRRRAPARPPTARASTAAPTRSSAGSRGASSQCAVGVIVDATFRRADDRVGVPGGLGDLPARLRGRVPRSAARSGSSAPVAAPATRPPSRTPTPDVVRRQADDGGVGDDVPADRHVVLRTDRPAADALDDLAALLDARRLGARAHAVSSDGRLPPTVARP